THGRRARGQESAEVCCNLDASRHALSPSGVVPRQLDDRVSTRRRTCSEGAACDNGPQYVEQALDVAVPIIGRPDRGSSALTGRASHRGVTEIPQRLRETRGVAFAKDAAAAASLD